MCNTTIKVNQTSFHQWHALFIVIKIWIMVGVQWEECNHFDTSDRMAGSIGISADGINVSVRWTCQSTDRDQYQWINVNIDGLEMNSSHSLHTLDERAAHDSLLILGRKTTFPIRLSTNQRHFNRGSFIQLHRVQQCVNFQETSHLCGREKAEAKHSSW